MQCIYGPIGTYWTDEPDENGCYSMRELNEGETAGELKSKTSGLVPPSSWQRIMAPIITWKIVHRRD